MKTVASKETREGAGRSSLKERKTTQAVKDWHAKRAPLVDRGWLRLPKRTQNRPSGPPITIKGKPISETIAEGDVRC